MPSKLSDAQLDDLVQRYLAGQSGKELAAAFGIGLSTVYRQLGRRGVPLQWGPHHAARASQGATMDELAHRATTREANTSQVSALESRLAAMLAQRGLVNPVPQKAIGPYNVDLFYSPLVVEVWGGGWHGGGHHAERFQERTSHVLNAGWWQVCVWCHAQSPLSDAAADKIIAYHQIASSDPAAPRQHWVIWGSGKPVRSRALNLH